MGPARLAPPSCYIYYDSPSCALNFGNAAFLSPLRALVFWICGNFLSLLHLCLPPGSPRSQLSPCLMGQLTFHHCLYPIKSPSCFLILLGSPPLLLRSNSKLHYSGVHGSLPIPATTCSTQGFFSHLDGSTVRRRLALALDSAVSNHMMASAPITQHVDNTIEYTPRPLALLSTSIALQSIHIPLSLPIPDTSHLESHY